MVKNEVYFRAVLIVSTLLLAGLVSAHILQIIDDIEEEGSEKHIDYLRRNFISASMLGPGSSTVIVISDPPSGEHAEISITQGGITIKDSIGISRVLVDHRITPSFPPLNNDIVEADAMNRVGVLTGGYKVRTPVELNFSIRGSLNGTVIFVHPEEEIFDERLEMMATFQDEQFLPESEWRIELELDGEPEPIVDYSGIILLDPAHGSLTSGSCPVPVILPPYAEIMLDSEIESYQGSIIIARYSVGKGDGTYHEVFNVSYQ